MFTCYNFNEQVSKIGIRLVDFHQFIIDNCKLSYSELNNLNDPSIRCNAKYQAFINLFGKFLKEKINMPSDHTIKFKSIEKTDSGQDEERILEMTKIDFLLLLNARFLGSLNTDSANIVHSARLFQTGYVSHFMHRHNFLNNFKNIVYPQQVREAVLWSDFSTAFRINQGKTTKCSHIVHFDMFTSCLDKMVFSKIDVFRKSRQRPHSLALSSQSWVCPSMV